MKTTFTFLAILMFCGVTKATTFPVNSQATLIAANTSSLTGDTIKFTANIVVTSTLTLTKSLTLLGQGYTISVPNYGVTDGGAINLTPSLFRPITITGSNLHTKIIALKIKGGSISGGCILNPITDTLTLFRVTISNGLSNSGGGGLYNSGVCYLTRSAITQNAASYGGGIFHTGNTAKLFIENSSITNNRSLSVSGGGGAAELNGNSFTYINNSTISSNQSTELGGALNIYSSTAYINNSSFTGNVTYSNTYKGGAIASNGATVYVNSCLFGYNYLKTAGSSGTPTAPTTFALDDIHAYSGTVNMYYCTYMANSIGSGVINDVIGNTIHTLAADGSTNDLFTGGVYTNLMGTDGAVYGTGKYFQPHLLVINELRQPTLKTGSYALAKGTATRFGYTGATPRIAYYNKTTLAWVPLIGTTTGADLVTADQGATSRPTLPLYPAVGAVERQVDDFYSLKVFASPNGFVNGASVYGDLYAGGDNVTFTALAKNGYLFSSFTSVEGTSGTITTNPATVTMNENKSFNMNFSSTTNFTVSYLSNEATSGSAPSPASQSYTSGSTATISFNTGWLEKTNFTFDGWNTQPNGSGTDYAADGTASYTSSTAANLTLYAKWLSNGTPLIVLPLRTLDYQVQNMNQKSSLIKWTVSNDETCNNFLIQRSANGTNFETIGTIKSNNSSDAKTYQFSDNNPMKGRNFYRVVAVSYDGASDYYAVKMLTFENKEHSSYSKIYPNPAVGKQVMVDLFNNENQLNVPYIIADASGKLIKKGMLNNKQVNQVDVGSLKAGVYFISILFENGNKEVHKINKL